MKTRYLVLTNRPDLKKQIMNVHHNLVKRGHYGEAVYIYNLLKARSIRLFFGGEAIEKLKHIQCTGRQSSSLKSYIFSY